MDNMFKLSTKGLDDLFSTQEQRDEEKLAKIQDVPLELIDPFPGHPFKVQDDEDMLQLVQSVLGHGVVTPATVTQKPDGRYTLISGHRRKHACELAGLKTLRCEVVELSDEDATILMVESNYHRATILPSEKAFAYKMRLDATKRQGKRSDLTLSPLGTKLDAASDLGKQNGESRNQIFRYIRLTYLIQELLDLTDAGKLKLQPAVELSYLDQAAQKLVAGQSKPPSLAQAKRLRECFERWGELTREDLVEILEEPRSIKAAPQFSSTIRQHIPQSVLPQDAESYICKALDHYQRWLLEQ